MKTAISRRSAMALGGALPLMMSMPASAQDAPAAKPQFAGRANTMKLGQFEVMTLLGGASMSENPIATFGLNADPEAFKALSEANFIPADRSGGSYTPTLVRTPDALVLFDAGMVAANTAASMAVLGIKPDDITHVVLTHMHGDHIGGLMQDGAPVFANAQFIVPKAENEYWAANPSEAYTAKVVPLLGDARFIDDGEAVMPGITAEAAYGHTPGHTTYLLESEAQQLLLTGDSFNHYVYSVQRPDWEVRFDVDKQMGIATRIKVLTRLAKDRIPFIGYHMPFPAAGFIAPDGDGAFRYVPVTYQFS